MSARLLFLCLSALIFTVFSSAAFAQGKVLECGVPKDMKNLDVGIPAESPADVCDVYTRQLSYRKQALLFHDRLQERQASFVKPHLEAVKAYKENLKELEKERIKALRKKEEEELKKQGEAQTEKTAEAAPRL